MWLFNKPIDAKGQLTMQDLLDGKAAIERTPRRPPGCPPHTVPAAAVRALERGDVPFITCPRCLAVLDLAGVRS